MLLDKDEIAVESIINNPIYEQLIEAKIEPNDENTKGFGAGRLIPPLLESASIVCAVQMGEGMVRNIEGMGPNIQILPKTLAGKALEEVVEHLD